MTTEARDVLEYLRRRRPELPWQLAADDTWDELVLSAWIWWDERRRERELLHSALRRGLSLAEIGRYLGITTRQGTRDYIDRLDALLADHHRHIATPRGPATGDGATDPLAVWSGRSRASRGADVHGTRASRAAARQRPEADEWITSRTPAIATVIRSLMASTTRVLFEDDSAERGDIHDYLEWLREDHASGRYSPATFAALGLVLGELRCHELVRSAAANHAIRTAIRNADQLRADYGARR